LPLSSLTLHFTVPTIVEFVWPLYPLTLTLDLTGGSVKSSLLLVSEWLQQLSISISYESESNSS
jgi:hypothetical protein